MDHYTQERDLQDALSARLHPRVPDVEILDVQLDQATDHVRIFIDSPTGVNHALCARVTSELLDAVPQFHLLVSSPGPKRPLRSPHHFQEAVGKKAKVRVRGNKRYATGVITAADKTTVSLTRLNNDVLKVAYDEIVRAHLDA